MLVIIECVGPAQDDPFVNHHINMFCQKTRFFRADCVLDLKDTWSSRRNRWWCILSAPAIGKIHINACTGFPDLSTVEHVLPSIRKWPSSEEQELHLSPVELEAFRVGDNPGKSYLLNRKGLMACALHCWGSQLHPCPCGCRAQGLSPMRLESRGLYGVLVVSAATGNVRHLHPQEAAALCGLDPNLWWGPECRLALGAVGQLASPIQAVWVFSHAMKALQQAQWQRTTLDPKTALMAYRTWLLARCRHLLSDCESRFPASETLAHTCIFEKQAKMTIHEMLASLNVSSRDRTIQLCWETFTKQDHLAANASHENTKTARQVEVDSDSVPTPTSVVPTEEDTTAGCSATSLGLTVSQVAIDLAELSGETGWEWDEPSVPCDVGNVQPPQFASPPEGLTSLQFLQNGDLDEPVFFRVEEGSTVDQLQSAEIDIRGLKRKAGYVFEDGQEVSPTHALRVGSSYVFDVGLCPDTNSMNQEPEQLSDPFAQFDFTCDDSDMSVALTGKDDTIVPVSSPVPWNDARDSFVGCFGRSFLSIHTPVVTSEAQAQSLLGQRTTIESRLRSLHQQQGVWSDDEIRWHLFRLQQACSSETTAFVIEPLLIHGCFQSMDFKAIGQWVIANHRMNAQYITAVLQNQHWFPVVLRIDWKGIQAQTWDFPNMSHVGLTEFVHSVADTLGLPVHSIFQLERRFAGQNFCGALSIAFLEHHLIHTPLPETSSLAEAHHNHLRQMFGEAVSGAEVTWRPWMWGAGAQDPDFDNAVKLLTPMLVSHGVPSDHAHHRAQQAVKSIGAQDVAKACQGKAPWKTLKTLGTNVKFQFITPDELQAQIDQRAGKGPVGKPPKKGKQPIPREPPASVAIDPTKLGLPEGSFTGGGKCLSQIPVTMLGPMAEGVVIVTWQQAEPYLRASQVIAQGPLALLILQGPVGGCSTTLHSTKVTVPARCLVNQEPLLLEANLVQLGAVRVTKSQATSPVEIDTVQVATVKMTLFRDECQEPWEQVSGAPMKYIIKTIPMLRVCRGESCSCPCWHNQEKINTTDAIIDVWRRQFLRAGYKPEPVASAVMFTVCIRIPQCLLTRILSCSGEGGVYVEPRSMDSREVSHEYEVIWVPKADKATVSHLRQTNPASSGLARLGDRFGLRVMTSQAAELHKLLRPDAVYLATGVRQHFIVGPIPYGTDRRALCKALSHLPWAVKPLQPVTALDGQRGVMWAVVAVDDPPTNIIHMSHGEVLITKQKENASPKEPSKPPVATPSTLSLCGATSSRGPDPWTKMDPWGGYTGPKPSDSHSVGLATAAESMHQLEHKIEQAVLSKIPQSFAMDQDDMPDKIQDLETKVQSLLTRQQKLEGIVQEQTTQTTVQFGQMQAQLNAHGQQISGHMESQQQQIQQMFESQMSQIRSLLSKRKCESEHE